MSNKQSQDVQINIEDTDPAKVSLLSHDDRSVASSNMSYRKLNLTDDVSRASKASSMRKVSGLLLSPVVMFKRKFRAGGLKGSIFSLITAILGAGTISLPYLSAQNGIVISIALILFGATISYFCGMLLVSCAEKVGSDKYEDFAQY